jgi:shikimate kinase
MTLKLKRTPGLYLVGFMGSGKSTIGRSLSDELGWCFFDIDQEIEEEQQCTIAQIFAERGEAAFRELESEILRRRVMHIEAGNPCVVALGGGAFVQQRNWEIIENNGVTVWLDCPLEIIHTRLGDLSTRPLASDPVAMEKLFEARRPLYARADYHVKADREDPSEITRKILSLPIF